MPDFPEAIEALLFARWHGNAVAVLQSAPFNGMRASPADLLALASALIRLADATNLHGMDKIFTRDRIIKMEIENA